MSHELNSKEFAVSVEKPEMTVPVVYDGIYGAYKANDTMAAKVAEIPSPVAPSPFEIKK